MDRCSIHFTARRLTHSTQLDSAIHSLAGRRRLAVAANGPLARIGLKKATKCSIQWKKAQKRRHLCAIGANRPDRKVAGWTIVRHR